MTTTTMTPAAVGGAMSFTEAATMHFTWRRSSRCHASASEIPIGAKSVDDDDSDNDNLESDDTDDDNDDVEDDEEDDDDGLIDSEATDCGCEKYRIGIN
jgi:hypothetical protein